MGLVRKGTFPAISVAMLVLLVPARTRAENLPPVDLSQPLSAEQCVRLALERNYDIRLAEDRLGMANGAKLSAWGGLLPSATGDWTYTHNRSRTTLRDFPARGSETEFPESRRDTRSYGISASQTLLSLPTLLNIVTQKRNSGASQADVRDAEHLAAFAVRQQYFTLIESIKLLEVSQEDQRLASEEQKRTESLFEVGSVARTDVLKARVRVAEAQSMLTASENRVQLERGRLATALALSPNEPLQVIESLEPRSDLPDSSSAYAEAASNRHDLSAARLRLRSASAARKAAFTSKLPFLSHAYNYSIINSPQDFDIDPTEDTQFIFIKPRTKTWSYQIGVTWNFFDGLVTEANIASSKARERQAEHSMESLSLQVQLEVKEALLNIRATRRQIETAREALASAEEDLKLSQERYSVGLGTILELIDAQVNLTRARSGEVQAMAALKRAEAQLDRGVGRASW